MPPQEKPAKTVIAQTRFLIVDSEPTVAEGLRRFLTSEGAPMVHVAPSSLLALRVLQDRKTPVDCIICAHRAEKISGLEFLANLRAGRWGGLSLQHMSFILLMPVRDANTIAQADSLKATGYILGKLDKDNVRASILKALDPQGITKALPNFQVAHTRASESDLILAPFPPSFGRLSTEKQQQAIKAVAAGAQKANLSGAVAAVYAGSNGETAFIAPQAFERFMSRVSVDALPKMLNRAIHVDWTGGDPTAEAAAPDDSAPLPLFEEDVPETGDTDNADRRRAAGKADKSSARGLMDDDIRGVAKAFKEMGPEEFVSRFVRHQTILVQGQAPGQAPGHSQGQSMAPAMREHYVSIDLLRKQFFPSVDMRSSKRAFQSLTHMLDQLMLRSLPFLPQDGLPSSLNLNIHSILTQTFENTLKTASAENLIFEIPQAMIVNHFEEFKKARDLIFARGGKIAVDQIYPDTLGALDFAQVGPNLAKLNWKGDLRNFSAAHRDFVKKTLDRGIGMVMSRVDDPAALEIAQEFGIRNFQGFLIDEMSASGTGLTRAG